MRGTSWPVSILAEQRLCELSGDQAPNIAWLREGATFRHREACEFILFLCPRGGSPVPGEDDEAFDALCLEMYDGGCTEPFIHACRELRAKGAAYVLFYA